VKEEISPGPDVSEDKKWINEEEEDRKPKENRLLNPLK